MAINTDDAPFAVVRREAASIKTDGMPVYYDRGGDALAAPSGSGVRSPYQKFGLPITFFRSRGGLVIGYVKGSIDWSREAPDAIAAWF